MTNAASALKAKLAALQQAPVTRAPTKARTYAHLIPASKVAGSIPAHAPRSVAIIAKARSVRKPCWCGGATVEDCIRISAATKSLHSILNPHE